MKSQNYFNFQVVYQRGLTTINTVAKLKLNSIMKQLIGLGPFLMLSVPRRE